MIPVSPAHWDALADAIGEASTEELYGPRPGSQKFVEYVECGTVTDAPNRPSALIWSERTAVRVAVALAAATALIVASAAIHGREASHATIDPCAMVLTREQGPVCR